MVILCDFDDTVADRNIATLLLDRFHPGTSPGSNDQTTRTSWRDLHRRFLDGEITLAAYQEIAFADMGTDREQQIAYVTESAALRPGFAELARYCAAEGIELAIVSHGLDFYIDALLGAAGAEDVPFFAVETGGSDGRPTFAYNYADPACAWYPGNCKCSVLESYRQRHEQVIYAGDGMSDTCPARRADYVFARDRLLAFCRAENIPHRELTDFHVVLDYLRAMPPQVRGMGARA
ncbi:MAG: MtnX-like HAD-IB family phosphatase [Chloroflexi bacterium]|nr:MtnX-like HAD-IB family phosphatase [Chloroflexota bacterium]